MTTPTSGGGKTKFTPSGKHNACPICGRIKDGDCRISPELVLCHKNTDHKVGDVIDGWAFTGVSGDGRTGKFTPHKPRQKEPEIVYGYSVTQRSKRYYKNGKKHFAVQHLVGGSWEQGAGPDPWSLYFENEALAGLDCPDSDGVVWEFEGEKCCELAVQGGLLAVSQPGHAHKPEQRAPRYQRLKNGGCTCLIYLADNDKTGETKAAEAVKGAEFAGLTITVLRAQQIWPGLPPGGSIDDAPGTVQQRVEALREYVSNPKAGATEPAPASAESSPADADEQFWLGLEEYAIELHRQEQPIRKRHASIRAYAYSQGFSLKDNEIGFVDKQAERKLHDWKDGYDASEVIRIPRTQWFWEGIFLLNRLNLLIAREKVGKTALVCHLIHTWLRGCPSAMELSLAKLPESPAILIAGPDQGLADWSWYLAKAGLATETVIDDDSADIQLIPEIKKIWPQDAPVFLDEEGIANIATHCAKHPGALLICYSHATPKGPLGLKENDADFAEPMRALARALAPHKVTTILIHHAGKGNEGERASTASRGSTAITAAASRVVQLAWLNEKDKNDQRIALTTQGRAAKPVGLVIEQEEACRFIKVGDLEEIEKEEARDEARNNLTERQESALAEVCDAWEKEREEMTAARLVERLAAKYTGKDKTRKARANLDQLYRKKLVDKRTLGSGDARRNLYRPSGADVGEAKTPDP